MRILLADDDPDLRAHTELVVRSLGFETLLAADGREALEILERPDGPPLAIVDFEMPHLKGPELCRRFRQAHPERPCYLILLTGHREAHHLEEGLASGANDYLRKPVDPRELIARLRVGERSVRLETELNDKLRELQAALATVRTLEGLLPICSYCKKIRGTENTWEAVDVMLSRRTQAKVSHSICPSCFEREVEPQLGPAKKRKRG